MKLILLVIDNYGCKSVHVTKTDIVMKIIMCYQYRVKNIFKRVIFL